MKIKEGFVLEQVGDSFLAVAVGELADSFRALVRMNSTGAFIWNQIADADRTAEEIVSAMVSAYDVPAEIAQRDVAAFTEVLKKNGILAE